MSAGLQSVLVTVLVVAAAMYAFWLLLPTRSRLRLARWLGFNPKTLQNPANPCDHCSADDSTKHKPPL